MMYSKLSSLLLFPDRVCRKSRSRLESLLYVSVSDSQSVQLKG